MSLSRRGCLSKLYNWFGLLCIPAIYFLLLRRFHPVEKPGSSQPHSPATEPSRKGHILTNVRVEFHNHNLDTTTDTNTGSTFKDFTLEYIRTHHLIPYNPAAPTNYSGSRLAWSLHQNKKWKQTMPKVIAKRLGFKRNGFFVECGALDGVFISNTLLLERTYDWTGLLVEADPAPLAHLKKRNRHAWVADVCLAPEPRPMKIEMYGHRDVVGHGFIPNNVIEKERLTRFKKIYNRKFEVQCFPLDMLMAAINRTEIDYFSLDVEGVELGILKTIPFDKIHIKLISVEIRPSNKESIQEFLQSKGYKRVLEIKSNTEFIHDDLYEFQT